MDMLIDVKNPTAELLSAIMRRPVTSVTVAPWKRYSSHEMRDLTVSLADGRTVSVMLKGLHESAHLEEARRARPLFLYNPRREIEVYQHVLSRLDLDTPTFWGAHVDTDAGEYWLLLENMRGAVPMWECEFEYWTRAARWLARMHAAANAAGGNTDPPPSLLRYDAAYYRRWADRAGEFCPPLRPIVQADRYAAVIRRLCAMPASFIHGEFYPSNILVEDGRIRPIDWETAAVGPALMDLAALSSGRLSDAHRDAIVTAYGPVDPDELALCGLHIAVQWLGWSQRWKPSKHHEHDWLAEAIALAQRLGI